MGGEEALGEWTMEGMQVCSWMDFVEGGGEGEWAPLFLEDWGRLGYSL